MTRRNFSRSARAAAPLLLGLAVGCSSGRSDNPTPPDFTAVPEDMAILPNLDLTAPPGSDLTSPPGSDLTSPPGSDLANPQGGLPCSPGSYRCGAGNAVEICNSTGTAWLYSSTCAVSCLNGLCGGACTPSDKRCNGNNVETCNAQGTQWTVSEMCTGTFCDVGRCARPTLEITNNTNLDGDILVQGDVIVRTGATLTSPAGNLSITTRGAILVETGASINVTCTGQTLDGQGYDGTQSGYGGGGGAYGAQGQSARYVGAPAASYGSATDAVVQPGARGGNSASQRPPGNGGGMLRLIAGSTITVGGQINANGCNGSADGSYSSGGGSGGGVLLATPGNVVISGAISAQAGSTPQNVTYYGGNGGNGRIKIVAGGTRNITGTVNGVRTDGLIPPLTITSNTHPSQDLIYNDNFPNLVLTWNQAFNGRQGYYYLVNTSKSSVPTPMNGRAVATESVIIDAGMLSGGSGGRDNFFHIVPIDASSTVGGVENFYRVRINNAPPSVTSSSHQSSSTWYMNQDVFFNWTFPVADNNVKGAFYVLDHYGTTVPTSTDTFIPVTQKNLLRMGLAPGVWVMHMVAQDQRGYLTKVAGHLRVNVGADPGQGTLLGQVVDSGGKPVQGAKVTINRGLYDTTTNNMGTYNFTNVVPAGTWEIRATSPDGTQTDSKSDMVQKGMSTTVNLTLK